MSKRDATGSKGCRHGAAGVAGLAAAVTASLAAVLAAGLVACAGPEGAGAPAPAQAPAPEPQAPPRTPAPAAPATVERMVGREPAWWSREGLGGAGGGAEASAALAFRGVGDGKTPGEALRKAREAARAEAVAVLRGVRVDSRYEEAVRLAGDEVSEHVDTYLAVITQGFLGPTAPMREAQVEVQHVDAAGRVVETTHRAFALLEVPADEFRPTVGRYERTAQALEEQADRDGAIHLWRLADGLHRQEAGRPDPRHLRKLLVLYREMGRARDALEATRDLLPLESDPAARARLEEVAGDLERSLAGGEFAFYRKRLQDLLSRAAQESRGGGAPTPRGLRVERIPGEVTPEGTVSYTVLCGTPSAYVAVWINDAEIAVYPTLLAHRGQAIGRRPSADKPPAPVPVTEPVLDRGVGPVEGRHALAILAFPGGTPEWVPEDGALRFTRAAVEGARRGRAGGAGRNGRAGGAGPPGGPGASPAASLAAVIGRIEASLASGEAMADLFSYVVRG